MEKYLTVSGSAGAEYEEKKSRFIASLCHAESEEQAMSFINSIRSEYWDARHNCFAYTVAGGKYSRFSDDGEPHGTAGKPILDVITGNKINDVVIVVTRYFGGILLGTGGLVRAYSTAAKLAVENAVKAEMVPCTVYETECSYTDHIRLVKVIENCDGLIKDTVFTDRVKIKYALRDQDKDEFCDTLRETFSARLTANECEKGVFELKTEKF